MKAENTLSCDEEQRRTRDLVRLNKFPARELRLLLSLSLSLSLIIFICNSPVATADACSKNMSVKRIPIHLICEKVIL